MDTQKQLNVPLELEQSSQLSGTERDGARSRYEKSLENKSCLAHREFVVYERDRVYNAFLMELHRYTSCDHRNGRIKSRTASLGDTEKDLML